MLLRFCRESLSVRLNMIEPDNGRNPHHGDPGPKRKSSHARVTGLMSFRPYIVYRMREVLIQRCSQFQRFPLPY